MHHFSKRSFATFCLLSVACISQIASAQSVWQKMKDAAKVQACKNGDQKACQDIAKQQQSQQGTPPSGQPATRPGQPQQAGQAQDDSGPFKPPTGTKIEPVTMAPFEQNSPFAVSPIGIHAATVSHSGSRPVIIYDGVTGPKFDQLFPEGTGAHPVVYSPDGNHWAYCGAQGSEWVVMRDGKEVFRSSESGGSGLTGPTNLGFTSNSQHLFFMYYTTVHPYPNRSDASNRFVFDEKATPPGAGNDLRGYVFSPDGNHVAYFLDETKDPAYPIPPRLWVDGQHSAYTASYPQWTSDNHLVTVQTLRVSDPRIGSVAELLFDGHPLMRADLIKAYVPPRGDVWVAVVVQPHVNPARSFLVVGGHQVPGSEIAGGSIGDVVFSPDGKHYAVVYSNASGRAYVFSDGKKGLEYPMVRNLAFTADSSTLVYSSYDVSNGQSYLVLNGEESDQPIPIDQVVLSPVGHDVITVSTYVISRNGKLVSIPVANPRVAHIYNLSYNPDGSHYAYILNANSVTSVVVDGVIKGSVFLPGNAGAPLTDIAHRPYIWSPDGKHVAFLCRSANPAASNDAYLCLDDKAVRAGSQGDYANLIFSGDGNHLFWTKKMSQGLMRIFADGKPVLEGFPASAIQKETWQSGPGGNLLVLLQDNDNSLKRFTITPSPESSVAAIFGGETAVAGK
jgi:hypothetical protein